MHRAETQRRRENQNKDWVRYRAITLLKSHDLKSFGLIPRSGKLSVVLCATAPLREILGLVFYFIRKTIRHL